MADSTLISEFNPNDKDKLDEKSSRKATKEDIEKMGLLKGFMMVLGYFKKKPLMMNECLSTLCVAPPGTGKTEGVVIPTICECNEVSMIINDPKPELKQKTSGYRATVGPVFIMIQSGEFITHLGIHCCQNMYRSTRNNVICIWILFVMCWCQMQQDLLRTHTGQ